MIVVLLLPVSFSGAAAAVIAAAIIPAARAMKVRRQVQIRMIPAVRAQIILSAPTPDFLEIVALQIQAASLNAVRRGVRNIVSSFKFCSMCILYFHVHVLKREKEREERYVELIEEN